MVGDSGGADRLRLFIDFLEGETSGLDALKQLQGQVGQTGEAFQNLSNQGTTATQTVQGLGEKAQQSNFHFSGWLVTLANVHGTIRNMSEALETISPEFGRMGQSAAEAGFALMGIAQGGVAAALGVANLAATVINVGMTMAKSAADFDAALHLQAGAMGMTETQALTMRTAMELTGGSLNQLSVAAQRVEKAMFDTAEGIDNRATKALANLGIQIRDQTTGELRSTYDVLQDVGKALSAIENPAQRAAEGEALLGMRARETVQALQDMNEKLPEANALTEEHHRIIENGKNTRDQYFLWVEKMKLSWMDFANLVAPTVIGAFNGISAVVSGQGAQGNSSAQQAASDAGMMFIPDPNEPGMGTWIKRPGGPSGAAGYVGGVQVVGTGSSLQGMRPDSIDDIVRDLKTNNRVMAGFGSQGGGGGAFTASQLDRSEMIANPFLNVFNDLTQNLPRFTFNLTNVKNTLAEWNTLNQSFDDRMRSITVSINREQAAQATLALTGQQYNMVLDATGNQHKVLTDEYQASQDKVKALQAAEHVLQAQRLEQLGTYADWMKELQKIQDGLLKQAQEAWKTFAPSFASSVGGAMAHGGAFVTAVGPHGESIGARLMPGESIANLGTITSINGQSVTPGGPSLNMPQAAEGGFVQQSGMAVIHKGETITPAGGAVNIYLSTLSPRDSADAIMEVLVQLGRTGRVVLN